MFQYFPVSSRVFRDTGMPEKQYCQRECGVFLKGGVAHSFADPVSFSFHIVKAPVVKEKYAKPVHQIPCFFILFLLECKWW